MQFKIVLVSIRGLIPYIFILFSAPVFSQISPERFAQVRIAKGKWVKAEHSLKKALRKDSINPEAKLVYAQWYFSPQNPSYQIDSAYRYTLSSLRNYASVDQRQRERMQRFPLDSTILLNLRAQIDSVAFERAKQLNTEESYIAFLNKFKYASQRKNAIELRDEVAFLDALKINSYQSFDHYLSKYPNSHRVEDAKNRYEKLLFEEKTKDGKLKSYISFFSQFPKSPYRSQVAEEIFEISTASGDLTDYIKFISGSTGTPKTKSQASNIAYHVAKQLNEIIPIQILNDSLRNVIKLEEGYWLPFLKNGKFGFMDDEGIETLAPEFDQIQDEYRCGNIIDDFLITSEGVISRTNKVLINGDIKAVEDLGFGLLLIETEGCQHLIHKSGFKLTPKCIIDARIVANQFVAIQDDKGWSLHAFNGRRLLTETYEDIRSEEEIVVLVKNQKSMLNTIAQIVRAADKNPLPDNMVFDEVRKLSTNRVLVKNGSLEGIVTTELKFEIPLDRQALTMTSFGFTKRTMNKVTTVGLSEKIDQEEFNDIKPYLNWLGLYRPNNIKLYHLPSARVVEDNLDSLWFSNRLAFALKNDSINVIFASGRKMIFNASTKVSFVKSPDSVKYFYLEEKNKKQLYEVDSGAKRFLLEFDYIEDLGYNVFLIEQKEKKGLVGLDGKMIIPFDYDAIVKTSNHVASLLRDKKFGIYDLKNSRLVKANYERNLIFFNEGLLVAFKNGFYGFIDMEENSISNFEFDEVKPWSDSTAFVKKNFRWMIYHIYDKKILQAQIKDFYLIKDDPDERIAIIHKENEYGVLSNKRGLIIQPTFSDVLNLGTSDKPLYFTEKNVEEADVFIVIYYDQNGHLIRRHIYEADEYDRIFCRDN